MALITAYIKDPTSDPAFQDRTFVFQILTKERSYHQKLIVELNVRLKKLPPAGLSTEHPDPVEDERKELQERIEAAQERQALLYSVMKRLTGVKGKTGGTAFLHLPSEPLPPSDW
jgi:acetyl esterase/lipase